MRRVLIVDDHPIVRAGLRGILSETPTWSSPARPVTRPRRWPSSAATRGTRSCSTSRSPAAAASTCCASCREIAPEVPVLVLSVHESDEYALRALRAGAAGYLTKDRTAGELVQALRQLLRGETYINRRVVERLVDSGHASDRPPDEVLSEREHEVLRLLASGKVVKEVAAILSLSKSTVSTYRGRILTKLGLHSNAELTRYAVEHGLLDD